MQPEETTEPSAVEMKTPPLKRRKFTDCTEEQQ